MAGLVGQTGFFPGDRRLRELDLLGDGLPLLNRLIPWERFRPILESVPKAKPKGPGGRKPYDRMLLFKMMVLQQLHNLSDEQTEYQVRDRLSFQRFLGLGLEEAVPDNTTLWLFRESLAQAKLTERLFTAFHAFLREAGYAARAGQIIDASFVTVPRQRMHRKPPCMTVSAWKRFWTRKIRAYRFLRTAPIVQRKRSKCHVKKVTAAESTRRRNATAP